MIANAYAQFYTDIYICVNIYIYIHSERERERGRENASMFAMAVERH